MFNIFPIFKRLSNNLKSKSYGRKSIASLLTYNITKINILVNSFKKKVNLIINECECCILM